MTPIRKEFEAAFNREFGPIETPYDAEHPSKYALWAAKWFGERAIQKLEAINQMDIDPGYAADEIRTLIDQLGEG